MKLDARAFHGGEKSTIFIFSFFFLDLVGQNWIDSCLIILINGIIKRDHPAVTRVQPLTDTNTVQIGNFSLANSIFSFLFYRFSLKKENKKMYIGPF